MAFCCQMYHTINIILFKKLYYSLKVTNISFYKSIIRLLFNVCQIGQIPRISQLVEIDDAVVGVFGDEKPHDMAPDKTGAARYQNVP